MARLAEPEVAQARIEATPELDGRLLALSSTPGEAGLAGLQLAMSFRMPSSWLQGLAGSPELVRTEAWRRDGDGYRADVAVTADGFPVSCTGSAQLRPDTAGSLLRMELELRVDVPLMGPVVESSVAARLREILARELGVLQDLPT